MTILAGRLLLGPPKSLPGSLVGIRACSNDIEPSKERHRRACPGDPDAKRSAPTIGDGWDKPDKPGHDGSLWMGRALSTPLQMVQEPPCFIARRRPPLLFRRLQGGPHGVQPMPFG